VQTTSSTRHREKKSVCGEGGGGGLGFQMEEEGEVGCGRDSPLGPRWRQESGGLSRAQAAPTPIHPS
jgi:hypothetical protein